MAQGHGWKAIALDEVETVPWRASEMVWRPLRGALATHIVGMAVFTAERSGQEVVEAHVEARDGRGHEEVYVVLRGRATFTLDGAELDAPAGTFVRVDPEVHRHAVAAEAGTAVLALGGAPEFVPAADEWVERARPLMRSDPARARQILDELRAERPASTGLAIGEALLAAAQGDEAGARARLAAVLDARPDWRRPLEEDPDLAPLLPQRGSAS
jgi:mannose-6-phosphate isomerase-like protein (cupin superfamily)